MGAQSDTETQNAAMRIQRALDDTLDRHAARPSSERIGALAETLRAELDRVSREQRRPVVDALRALNPDEERVVGIANAGPSAREAELEAEVERLRAALAERPQPAAAPSAAGGALVTMLVGSSREREAWLADADGEQRLVATVRALLQFVGELGRAYLRATSDDDHTMAGRIEAEIAAAVTGRSEELTATLETLARQIGGQLLAFRRACDDGARELLRQLAPAAIEADATKASSGMSRRLFFYNECWEIFAKRYEELRGADDLYPTYFDGAYRKALLHQGQGSPDRKGER